jgi:nicotinic acid mononucleotide adenylyltransferase
MAQQLITLGAKIHWVEVAPDTISSSEIRDLLKQKRVLSDQLPAAVADYIALHHLYC